MPELPEVQTIVADLQKHVVGSKISRTIVAKNYNRALPDHQTLIQTTQSATIIVVHRVAKNIILELDSEKFVAIHLAMTGRVLYKDPQDKSDKWIKVLFELLTPNSETMHLRFCDVRMFGKVQIVDKPELKELKLKYGPEPIDPETDHFKFLNSVMGKRTNIKTALLDQTVVSGLGNIYATDSLFLSGIHPLTPTKNISIDKGKKLFESAKTILLEGIKNRGSTLEDKMYVDIFGKSGQQQNFFRIYNKSHCPTCKTKVEVIKINGRGSYFCPTCQPLTL